ncbi:MAG TPA: ATP-binding protein [Candidatus Polarisedimenticolaceae bacterium]|nr:ATP-binding protein [Candidatus Polarisedimenticolaceae bacterium]
MRNRGPLRAGLVLLFLALGGQASAKYRVTRVLDWQSGLPVSFTGRVEQDPEGFLWVGTSAGTFRYDGSEMVLKLPIGRGLVPGSALAGTFVVFHQLEDGQWEFERMDGKPIPGPDGRPVRAANGFVSPDGALWVIGEEALRLRGPDGVWSPRFAYPDGSRMLAGGSGGRNGTLFLPCRDALYRVDRSGRFTRVAPLRGVLGALDRSDGSTVLGTFVTGRGFVYEVRDGVLHEIDRHPTRFMALTEREGALWISYDNMLARLAPGEPRETITAADGLLGGGAMMVDHEGSLWVATGHGLVQYPEPDTLSFLQEAPGLGRHVVLDHDTVWMSTWSGLYRARREGDSWTVAQQPRAHIGAACIDGAGALWTVLPDGFSYTPREGAWRLFPQPGVQDSEECAVAGDGGLWFPTGAGLFFLPPGAKEPRLVLAPEPGGEVFRHVYEDSRGMLWATREEEICRTPARPLEREGRAAWSCLPAMHQMITGFLEMESGALWASTYDAGVLRLRGGAWEQIPGSRDLLSQWTADLARSPRGGVWITGEGNLLRVRERPDLPSGWEVLERPGRWQGLPTPGVFDVAEAPDGTLWVASNKSLIRMPPRARDARPGPPRVALVEAAVDGRPLQVESGRVIRLAHDRNRLELRFAALSYRDPSLIRYRSRSSRNDPWSAPTKRPFFRFVDLPPRRYEVEVEASLDGKRWSAAKTAVVFEVLPPWWGTWWFRTLAAASLVGLLVLAYRLRVAALLKLERQRMRIAMDLHDEVGSGLGSIGVLAGILARPDLPEPQRADLTGRITGVARELSQSLGDIVWSLRSGSGNLDSLWAKVLDRARPLFAGGSPALRIVAPDPVPAAPLSLVVRRNVSLIVIEALHNAARHAAATSVALSLRSEDGEWVVSVADDGQGLHPVSGDETRRGLGLEGIRLRAEEMGGSVTWESPQRGGTQVVIRFRSGRG